MFALTPAERRGALVVVLLLALGAAWDLWRAHRLAPDAARDGPRPSPAAAVSPEGALPGPPPGGGSPALDLNRATAAELDALPGVGPVLAGRILEHRARHGPFERVEDLLAVKGIGPRLVERLRPRVHVKAPEAR
jgi:competence protein ComEA